MGHYFRLLMINGAKFISWLQHSGLEIDLPVEIHSMTNFERIVQLLNNGEPFGLWELDDNEVVHTVWGLSEVKSHGLTGIFHSYLPADLGRIMLEAESGFPLEIFGEKVPRFVKEIDMIGVKLRDIGTTGMDKFHTDDVAYMATIFKRTTKEMHAGLAKGYSDAIAVLCG